MKKMLTLIIILSLVGALSGDTPKWTHTARIAGGVLWTDMTDEEMRDTIHEIYEREQSVILTWVSDPLYGDWSSDLEFLRKASDYIHDNYPDISLIVYQGPLEIITPDVDVNKDGKIDPGKHSIYTDHPAWLQVGLDERKAVFYGDYAFWIGETDEDVWLCPNDPEYKEIVKTHFYELAQTGIDGVWVDIPKFQCDFGDWDSNWACHCEDCRKKFKEDTGFELPDIIDWDSIVWKTWILWRQQVITDYIQELNDTVKSVNPQCLLIVEHWRGLDAESVREAWSPLLLRDVTDCLAHEYAAASYDSSTYDYYNYLRDVATYLFYRGIDTNASWILAYSSDEKGQKMLASTILTAGCNFYDTDAPGMSGTVNLEQQQDIFHWIKTFSGYYYEGELWANIGVLYSKATMDFMYHEQWGEGDFYCEFMGISMMLLQSHIPYKVITTLDDLDQFHTLILPNTAAMSDQEVEKVNKFVEKGGKVIATGETGEYDEWGVKRSRNLLRTMKIPALGAQYYRDVEPYNSWSIPDAEERGTGEEFREQFLDILELLKIPHILKIDAPKEVIVLPVINESQLILRVLNLSGVAHGEPEPQKITVTGLWSLENGSFYPFLSEPTRFEGNPVTVTMRDHALLVFTVTEPVTILTNPFDEPAAELLKTYLVKNGYFVEVISGCSKCMERVRERTQLIILGGHQAQTTGEFTSILLTEEEKKYLEQEKAQKIFLKPDGFSQGQIVIIAAGNEREDTYSAVETHFKEILRALSIPSPAYGFRYVMI